LLVELESILFLILDVSWSEIRTVHECVCLKLFFLIALTPRYLFVCCNLILKTFIAFLFVTFHLNGVINLTLEE
jgi:hypothetical protein